MDEKKMRQIAEEVFNEKLNETQFGFTSIPYHVHNGTDSPVILPLSVTGFASLPANNPDGIVSPTTLDTQIFTFNSKTVNGSGGLDNKTRASAVYIYPTPIIYGYGVGTHSAFNGGDAPYGTLICFSNAGTTAQLFIKIDDGTSTGIWRGVTLPLTA